MHNTKVFDNGCGGTAFVNGPEKLNVGHYAKSLGYTTFYAGKYLNNYGGGGNAGGGLERIPPGWDQWYGLKGNSKYYEYAVSNNGVAEHHGSDYATDYFTDRIANRTLEFLANATKNDTPFFAMLGSPASHGPNDPAPQVRVCSFRRVSGTVIRTPCPASLRAMTPLLALSLSLTYHHRARVSRS